MSHAGRPWIAHRIDEARQWVWQARAQGRRVGLVPTMGALHAGHLSLVRAARAGCDAVAVSIFVNPTQFGPGEDLDRYPRTWDADLEALTQQGVDLVFAPSIPEMYPPGATTVVEPSRVADDLEGRCRPGHFRGVATVVLKLFQILPAQQAYFGEKDRQQCLVIRDLVRDLNVPIDLTFCPIVREPDGLAMSSRNRYLQPAERAQALALARGLDRARQLVANGQRNVPAIEQAVRDVLTQAGIERIDYVALRNPDTLEPLAELDRDGVLLIAAHVGVTRLIDNGRLRPELR